MWVEGDTDQLAITGVGDVCGHHVQEPDSVVVYSFTGVAYVEESGTKRTYNKEGFLDVRMAGRTGRLRLRHRVRTTTPRERARDRSGLVPSVVAQPGGAKSSRAMPSGSRKLMPEP